MKEQVQRLLRSPEAQLRELDSRLGPGRGAHRERARLLRKLQGSGKAPPRGERDYKGQGG